MSFPRYERYKDSGVEWLGEVPEHWSVKRLKNNARLVTEKAIQRTNPIALEHIESWTGRLLSTETEFEGDGVAFRQGDILFGKLRPYLAKAYLAEANGEAVGDFHVIRPCVGLQGQFLFYQIINRDSIDQIDGSTFGAKMPRVGWDFMSNMLFATPSNQEQVLVAKFLDQETAKIDELIEEQRRLIELLKEKRQAVISHAVTKGLNPNVPMKHTGDMWLGSIPDHWAVVSAKFVSTIFVPQRNKPELNQEGDGLPWITMDQMKEAELANTGDWVSQEAAEAAGTRTLNKGAVIASCVGNFGAASVNLCDVVINQQLQAFITNDRIQTSFLRYRVESAKSYFEQIGTAATIPYVNQQGFASLPISLPPLSEQDMIVVHLDCVISDIDDLIASVTDAAVILGERRSALISAAVTGKIDVRGEHNGLR